MAPLEKEIPFLGTIIFRFYVGVSENNGIPKSSILTGFSIINRPFWGTLIFGNTHVKLRGCILGCFLAEAKSLLSLCFGWVPALCAGSMDIHTAAPVGGTWWGKNATGHEGSTRRFAFRMFGSDRAFHNRWEINRNIKHGIVTGGGYIQGIPLYHPCINISRKSCFFLIKSLVDPWATHF